MSERAEGSSGGAAGRAHARVCVYKCRNEEKREKACFVVYHH
jgi:hypothetical protein